jgi:hypothetical protein
VLATYRSAPIVLKPRQDRLLPPRRGSAPTRTADGRDGIECPALFCEINVGITLRGFQTDMPEPAADQIELDAGLEEVYRTRVSKRAGVHAFTSE